MTGSPWPVVVLVVQHAFLVGLWGHTFGMAVMRIKCVSVADRKPIGIPLAALRGGLLALIVPALIMDAQRRGWHDRLAGSIVLRAVPADRDH
nr:RDD family protein [Virgisporangium aliadipatigenens]